jgi:hypothetical protein
MDPQAQGNLLLNVLGIANGNRQSNRQSGRRTDISHSRTWSKSRGHKAHGRKHGKDC